VTVLDASSGAARVALIEDGRVVGALFAGPRPVEVARAHVLSQLNAGASAGTLLAGRPSGDASDPGATVCSCYNVGVNTILHAIETQGLATVEAIGAALGAGSNCGSCRPEIRSLLARSAPKLAAE
jgi:assimilatory nitrate reductase catalytic subunit